MATHTDCRLCTSDSAIPATSHASLLRAGLSLLFDAHQYSADAATDVWQFALEIGELRRAGLMNNEFRWLISRGVVHHVQEITLPGDAMRSFRPLSGASLVENSCFVLTESGVRLAGEVVPDLPSDCGLTELQGLDDVFFETAAGHTSSRRVPGNGSRRCSKPNWDSETRVLQLNEIVVKRFRWKALNQECILSAFEEDGWPERVDDPLSPAPEQDSKRRLADTIKNLNGKQQHRLLRFHGDGTGEGVTWEVVGGPTGNGRVE